ncbi:hypothetical protein HXX76_004707 [Chlamydomonas incerta]|uniref:DNA helicase n=1 Tax=Chlamydomonas incerta TaxID=51695 RepID=A0A835W6P1_CHLIN|nr:hypothetical protein HXX76_004707 [Chlamydomonas incerta]|eukprot:KAG2439348.1 hypothetical protein HXX76_004707 [Chlamydomonas incerta]
MGKKQPLAAVQKQKGATDITKFFGRKPSGAKEATPGRTTGVAGVRAPGGRAPTPGKHLLDNVLLSQDLDDGLQVVWASSPTAALSPQKATGESQDTARTASQQHTQGGNNSQASRDGFRRALAQAAQKAASSDAHRPDIEGVSGGAGASQAQSQAQAKDQQHDENAPPELQQLLERKSSHRLASTSSTGGVGGGHAVKRQRSGNSRQLGFSDRQSAAAGASHTLLAAPGSDAAPVLHGEAELAPIAATGADAKAAGRDGAGATAAAAPAARDSADVVAPSGDAAAAAAAFDAEEEQLMAEAMAGLEYKTPAAARQQARLVRSALRRNTDGGRLAGGAGTPGLISLGGGAAAAASRKRPLLTCSNKKGAPASGSGHKRRALLDLLDQVELMVKQRTQPSQAAAGARPPSSGPGEEEEEATASRHAAGCTSAVPMATENGAFLPPAFSGAAAVRGQLPDAAGPASQTPPPLPLQTCAPQPSATTGLGPGMMQPAASHPMQGKVLAAGRAPAPTKASTSTTLSDDDEDEIDFDMIDQIYASHAGGSNNSGGAGRNSATQAATAAAGTTAADAAAQAAPTQPVAAGSAHGSTDVVPLTQALAPPAAVVVVGPASRFQRPPLAPTSLPAASHRQEPSRQPPQFGQLQPQLQASHLPQPQTVQPALPLQTAPVPAPPLYRPAQQLPQPEPAQNQPRPPEPAQQLSAQPQPAEPASAVAPRASATSGGGGGWDDDDDDGDFVNVDVDALVAKANISSRPASPSGPAAAAGVPVVAQVPVAAGVPSSTHRQADPPHPLSGRPPPASMGPASAHQPHPQPVQHQQQALALPGAPAVVPAAGMAGSAGTQEAGIGVLGGSGGREDYHYVVLEVQPRGGDGSSRSQNMLRLRCFNEHKGTELLVFLRDMWAEQEVRPGDSANVLGGQPVPADEACPAVEINRQQGLFVLHPDLLLSGTSVIKDCARQAWLDDRVSGGLGSDAALAGNISHELLQRCLQPALEGRLDEARVRREARLVIRARAPELVQQAQLAKDGTSEASVEASLNETVQQLLTWLRTYMAPLGPGSAASGDARLGGAVLMVPTREAEDAPVAPPAEVRCRVDEVLDIEENIWAPKYGIKGQIDATFRVSLSVKDPLHNQLTMHGGLASKVQQQQQPQPDAGGHGCHSGPARFHGQRHHASDGGAPVSAPGGSGPSGSGPWPQQLTASVASACNGQGPAPALQRQHSWSAGSGPEAAQPAQAQQQQAPPIPGVQTESIIVPFEYKSGQVYPEHQLQVLLYLLLMEDRYRTAVRKGLLFHKGMAHMATVPYSHATLASVMVKRNRLAAHLVGAASRPPPPLRSGNNDKCGRCFAKSACAVYLAAEASSAQAAEAAAQGGAEAAAATQAPGSGQQRPQQPSQGLAGRLLDSVHPELQARVGQIPPAAAAFFAHWCRLVDLEEQAARGNRSDLWALTGEQREQLGGCVSRLVFCREEAPLQLQPNQQHQQQQGGAEGEGEVRYCYVFSRQPALPPMSTATGATDCGTSVSPAGDGNLQVASAGPAAAERVQLAQGAKGSDAAGGGLLSAGFAPGDMGVLSVEGRHVNAARVSVAAVTQDTITLSCRKRINIAKLSCPDGGGSSGPRPVTAPLTWRLDRDESASHFTLQRSSLALLALPEMGASYSYSGPKDMRPDARNRVKQVVSSGAAWRTKNLEQLRRLVVDLEAPQQGSGAAKVGGSSQQRQQQAAAGAAAARGGGGARQVPSSSQVLASNSYLRHAARGMNGEQLAAVGAALNMCHYSILLGMPGTGKTTTIVHIIRALVASKVRVFVSSYTNSAVDNILLKLAASLPADGGGLPADGGGAGADSVKFVRLGSAHSVHPGVRRFMPGGAAYPDTSVAGLQHLMNTADVVGCTCLSVNSPLLTGQSFGVVILDEASQATLPASLGPLALGRSFLLVGDHYQLSPLVQSREAAAGGLGVSLFRRLSEAHPQAVVTLSSQYRMCADIMALSNALVYNGRMRCGSNAVATAQLHLPRLPALAAPAQAGACPPSWPASLLPAAAWLQAALVPEARVVFLDTDGAVGCGERMLQDGVVNPGEVRLVHGLVAALAAAGLPPGDVGVASPYKAQVAALQGALAGFASPQQQQQQEGDEAGAASSGVEVLTIDRYQGRDKAAILLSLVRSNPGRGAGRLLADWQRLNVALTRARTKLLLVGSAATASSIPLLAELLRLLMDRPGGVLRLPPDCLETVPALSGAAGG